MLLPFGGGPTGSIIAVCLQLELTDMLEQGFSTFSDFSSDDPIRMLMLKSRPPTFFLAADLGVWGVL